MRDTTPDNKCKERKDDLKNILFTGFISTLLYNLHNIQMKDERWFEFNKFYLIQIKFIDTCLIKGLLGLYSNEFIWFK